jgi:hypothetical protein
MMFKFHDVERLISPSVGEGRAVSKNLLIIRFQIPVAAVRDAIIAPVPDHLSCRVGSSANVSLHSHEVSLPFACGKSKEPIYSIMTSV